MTMRKLKLQMQLTLDGLCAGPNGELDWMTWEWDDALKEFVTGLTTPVDLILLGRKTSEGFIAHWGNVAADPAHPEYDAGRKFTDTRKIVFSRTLDAIAGPNAELMHEADAETINALKAQPGGDIIVYGGADFVGSLVQQGLIDDYYLFIDPVAIGEGLSIFRGLKSPRQLKLEDARAYDCGITVLHYKPA